MQVLGILIPLISLVSFVAFVWLTVVAFKKHPAWGICVFLFSPISAIIFAVKHWREAKVPFLVSVGSSIALIGMVFMTFAAVGGMAAMEMAAEMENFSEQQATMQFQQDVDDSAPAIPNIQPVDETGGGDVVAEADENPLERKTPTTLSFSTKPQTEPKPDAVDSYAFARMPIGTKPIRVADAGSYVGRVVRVIGTDGVETKGYLAEKDGSLLTFEKHQTGGTYSFQLHSNDIETLYIID
ncbi:MAG: hypothetical protein GY716_17880 [bacterium]|nr:hypothetical protein [bacterium]